MALVDVEDDLAAQVAGLDGSERVGGSGQRQDAFDGQPQLAVGGRLREAGELRSVGAALDGVHGDVAVAGDLLEGEGA